MNNDPTSFAIPDGEIIDTSNIDVAALDRRFMDEDRVRALTASEFLSIPYDHLRVWMAMRARYGLPTMELVEWLKERIAGRRALEIGAGQGDLGFHLGIPMTDSYQQVNNPETVAYMTMYRLQGTKPPKDVECEDGENAVRRRKPEVVVASYVTEKYIASKGSTQGNMHGIRYEYIIERCNTFILIGNKRIHGQNRALKLPHEELSFPWQVMRARNPELNRIWVWQNSKR